MKTQLSEQISHVLITVIILFAIGCANVAFGQSQSETSKSATTVDRIAPDDQQTVNSKWTALSPAPPVSEEARDSNPISITGHTPTHANASGRSSAVFSKPPDLGAYWLPISNNGGTYVYSNSFISDADGIPTDLGMWLLDLQSGPIPSIRFEIWGNDGGAPDPTNIIATTGSIAPAVTTTLAFYSAPVLPGASNLTTGSMYWFCATVVGEPVTTGEYQVGGHTQNSVYADNGTFWYSNDPAGIVFDGQSRLPEIAFELIIDDTPVSVPVANWALLLGALFIGTLIFMRYRR